MDAERVYGVRGEVKGRMAEVAEVRGDESGEVEALRSASNHFEVASNFEVGSRASKAL